MVVRAGKICFAGWLNKLALQKLLVLDQVVRERGGGDAIDILSAFSSRFLHFIYVLFCVCDGHVPLRVFPHQLDKML